MLVNAVALASSLSSTVADTVPARCLGTSAVIHQSVASRLTNSAPKALHFLQERGVLILAVAAALVVVAVVASRAQMRRELASRVRFAVIPTESFDPSAEEILRFAAGLSRTRRVVRRLGAGRTDAIRLRLVAVAGGRVVQLLEGPRRSLSILRNAGFDQVDLRPPEAVAGLLPPGPDRPDRRGSRKPKALSSPSAAAPAVPSDDRDSAGASAAPARRER